MSQERKQEVISNIIYDSQYITKVRLERFIKENYDINEKGDCYKFISEKIVENLDDLILKLQEYEYTWIVNTKLNNFFKGILTIFNWG